MAKYRKLLESCTSRQYGTCCETLWWFVLGSLVAFAGCVWVALVILVTSEQRGRRIWERSLKAVVRKMWASLGGPRCGEVLRNTLL